MYNSLKTFDGFKTFEDIVENIESYREYVIATRIHLEREKNGFTKENIMHTSPFLTEEQILTLEFLPEII